VAKPESDGRSTRVDLMHEGKSVSRLWLTPFTLHVGEALVRMDGVGGVGTDEAYRSRGYSRRVLQAAIDHMTRGDAALTMLYGIRDFYPKFGYATAGPDHIAILTDLDRDSTLPSDWSVRDFAPDDLADVQRIHFLNTSRAVGAAQRDSAGSVWEHLQKVPEGSKKDACRVVVGPDGAIHGYLWRANWCWYVNNVLESNYKRALVLGEVMADGPAAADAVLAACRMWANQEPVARKVNEVVLAFAPEGPLAAAAMRQDARLLRNYSACGGSMARVINVERLMRALLPELEARLKRAADPFEGTLEFQTEIGSATLRIDSGTISIAKSAAKRPAKTTVKLPQYELARLALGAFPPEDVLARLPDTPSAESARVLQALFPLRHPHMHLPDRY
jgi:hypothetical protein